MSRYYHHIRRMYPAMLHESTTIDTKSFGKVFVGRYMRHKIDVCKSRLRKVMK